MPEPLISSRPVFVTSRQEKAEEAKRLGFDLECVSLDLPEIQGIEPGEIVEAKAREAYSLLQRPLIVEDSGLAIRAWGVFPDALVKWLEKSAGLETLARMLDGFEDRGAIAICAIALFDGSRLVTARGELAGRIASRPRGSGGFGWDALFLPGDSDRTFAEMTGEEKDAISHRRRAWEQLSQRLAEKRVPGR